MPKRKKLPKIPDYTGIPSHEYKLVVQKSNPLKTLSETGMSLVEFKILDAYLSRIDSHQPEKRFVRFEKGELEKILGVDRIRKEDLDARLEGLFKTVTIRDKYKNKGFTKIGLFERAEAKQDDDGLWQIDLVCTPSAMEYIFNIEVMGYLPYMLKNIIELTSRYSYVLYIYLESRRKSPMSNTWKIDIEDLKQMLRCTSDTYRSYKRFNDLVLKKCHKEITKKTNLLFSYQPIDKKGRRYTNIQFTIITITDELVSQSETPKALPEQLSLIDFDNDEPQEIEYGGELANLLGSAACDDEFSPEQIRILQDLVIKAVPNGDNMAKCDYLIHQVHKLNLYDKDKKTVKNRFNYLRKMIEQEVNK